MIPKKRNSIFNFKAQAAIEYLMIIALTLGIILPTTYLFFRYGSQSSDQIIDSQIIQVGRGIIDTAETVYFSGESSKIVLQLNMPEGIEDINIIDNRELVFNVTTSYGEIESVFFSTTNITSEFCTDNVCSLSSIAGKGLKGIKIESFDNGNSVLISKQT